jgi:hypothetical protein
MRQGLGVGGALKSLTLGGGSPDVLPLTQPIIFNNERR